MQAEFVQHGKQLKKTLTYPIWLGSHNDSLNELTNLKVEIFRLQSAFIK